MQISTLSLEMTKANSLCLAFMDYYIAPPLTLESS